MSTSRQKITISHIADAAVFTLTNHMKEERANDERLMDEWARSYPRETAIHAVTKESQYLRAVAVDLAIRNALPALLVLSVVEHFQERLGTIQRCVAEQGEDGLLFYDNYLKCLPHYSRAWSRVTDGVSLMEIGSVFCSSCGILDDGLVIMETVTEFASLIQFTVAVLNKLQEDYDVLG